MQLLLCFGGKRKAVKCIPIGLVVLGALLSGATGFGVFGTYSAGAISGNGLVALILAVVTAIAAVGVLLGWLVYGLVRYIRRHKRS